MGTKWSVVIDTPDTPVELKEQILQATHEFEKRFSRFIEGSETTAFRFAEPGKYLVSDEFAELLAIAKRLRHLTGGQFDPAVGGLMEAVGYDQAYSFVQKHDTIASWIIPSWDINEHTKQLTLEGSVIFDLGGFAKGYWIDRISQMLLVGGYVHHLVDGGGDMMATTKANGEGWRIAIEWPGKVDTAIGETILANKGFAASDVVRRSWGEWHHIVSPTQKRPTEDLIGAVAIAQTACAADQMTSALLLTPSDMHSPIAPILRADFLLIDRTNKIRLSTHFSLL